MTAVASKPTGKALRLMATLILFTVAAVLATTDHLDSAVTVAAAAFGLAVLAPVNAVPRRTISLESFALVAMAGYALSVPVHHALYRDYEHVVVIEAFTYFLVASASFVLGTWIASLIGVRSRARPTPLTAASLRRYRSVGWIIALIGVTSAVLGIGWTVGFDSYFSAGYAGRALLKREAGPIELGLYHAVLGLVIVAMASLRDPVTRRRMANLVPLVVVSIMFVAYVSFLGIRRPSFLLATSLIILYGVAGKGYRKPVLAVLAVTVLVFFGVFASFRQVLTNLGATEALSFIHERIEPEWFDFSNTELGAPFRVVLTVLTSWSDEPLRLGMSYLSTGLYLLPRWFDAGVTSLSQEYTFRHFSNEFIEIGGNMGFSPVAEAYVNFRIPGIIACFALVGYCISRIQWRALTQGGPIDLVVYAIAAPWFVFFFRSDFAAFSKALVYSLLVPYVLARALLWLERTNRSSVLNRS